MCACLLRIIWGIDKVAALTAQEVVKRSYGNSRGAHRDKRVTITTAWLGSCYNRSQTVKYT